MKSDETTREAVGEFRIFYLAAFVLAALSILSLTLLLTGAASPT